MKMTKAQREIWRAAYAAAFVADVANMARHLNTNMGATSDRDGVRYQSAEVARGVADEAVLGLRETEKHHATEVSNAALWSAAEAEG